VTYLLLIFTFLGMAMGHGCPYEAAAKAAEKDAKIRSGEIADPETTTPNGCTCNSLCGATIEDAYGLDWCTVEGECGEYSPFWGHWDHCLYKDSSRPDWVALDWKTKHEKIWSEVKADPTFGKYDPPSLFLESVITSFENEWDIMPAGRVKAIHGIGAVCPFTVDVSENSPFSGLLKPGAQITGFIRMGPGIDFMDPLSSGFLPGAAIKFLRSGTHSANWVLFNTLNPLPDNNHNLFSVPLQNHVSAQIDSVVTVAATKKFCTTGHCVTKVGLSHIGTHDQDGMEYKENSFPFKITFVPTGEIQFQEEKPDSYQAFMDQFKQITVGTNLYTFKAHTGPDDTEGMVIGDVIIEDECLSSNYGDTRMFFKHQWIEDDVAAKPEWTEGLLGECYCNGLDG